FTPDREGTYTIKLVVSAGGQSASDTMQVQAVAQSCNSSSLSISPVSLTVGGNQTKVLSGFGGSKRYNWSFVTNASGGSISTAPGPSATYISGNNTGQDVIRLTDVWCGSVDLKVSVRNLVLPEPVDVVATNVTSQTQMTTVNVTAKFNSPVIKAEMCVDDARFSAPGQCQTMNVAAGGLQTTASANLLRGPHVISVRGFNTDWGGVKTVRHSVGKTVVLLLNGYKFNGTGPHPEQWRKFLPTIDCQIQEDFSDLLEAPNLCTFGTYCVPGNNGYGVCVVDNLNSKGDINQNIENLRLYIRHRKWIDEADNLILIGHSYGGQISRAYAKLFPSKVKAIITLDTPHQGAIPSYVTLLTGYK
ncbi:MAG: alpha/beta hydrolase, partial [Anaerolineae bacterium]|nr:alpha/beta hydrolase [Anaerolineae bacterium]